MWFAFKSNQFNNEWIWTPAIRIRDILNNYTSTYTDQLITSNDYIVNSWDILIGMDWNFYLSVWAGKDWYLVQRVCKIKWKDNVNNWYLLQALKKPIQFLESTITWTTVAHLSSSDLKKIHLLIPNDKSLLNQFDLFTKESIQYQKQNQSLKDQRDLLLRKLIG